MNDSEIIQSIERRISQLKGKHDLPSKLVLQTLKEDLYRRQHPQPKTTDITPTENKILNKLLAILQERRY